METRPPTVTRILVAVGFALSCFGLLLFLWLAFGGPIPLRPEGYRFQVPFDEATQLAVESDVRISGVSVGKVKRIDLDDQGFAEATIEVDERYAPVPSDTRAILRQKTLLGETYVELTPGSDDAPTLPEGGDLPVAQVSDAVQLDEIFRTFDDRTRAAFQAWMQGQAAALRGRGDDLSVAIASLDPFAEEADRALRILDTQEGAVRQLVRDAGETFQALSERRGQLSGLITNAQQVFATTAARNEDLADTFEVFPTFLRESRTTLTRLEEFARDTDPLVLALGPAARELQPTLLETQRLAPQLKRFFIGLRQTNEAAPRGFAATRALLDKRLPPLLTRFNPWLAQFNSILEVMRMYRHEVTSLLGNVAAATHGVLGVDPVTGAGIHYLRTEAPLGPEALAGYPQRLQISRTNPYLKPLSALDVRSALDSFETRQCAGAVSAFLDPATPTDPVFNARTGGDVAAAQDFFDRLQQYAFVDVLDTDDIPAPPCNQQAPYASIGVSPESSDYLHVREQP
ncbi:MAG TPA: MlaD family protein [Solirubrobacterales bacterium]|nr:MlaD family protein [Solirubrobacterales bacterium]